MWALGTTLIWFWRAIIAQSDLGNFRRYNTHLELPELLIHTVFNKSDSTCFCCLKTVRQCLSGLVVQIPCSVHCSPELPDAPWQQMTNFLCAAAKDYKNRSCTHTHTHADFIELMHLVFSTMKPVELFRMSVPHSYLRSHTFRRWMYITRLTFYSSC